MVLEEEAMQDVFFLHSFFQKQFQGFMTITVQKWKNKPYQLSACSLLVINDATLLIEMFKRVELERNIQ